LEVEEPIACWYAPAFHLHPTLPRVLGAPLIWDKVVQVGEPREKRLLAVARVVKVGRFIVQIDGDGPVCA
jgi:hypothetical protein